MNIKLYIITMIQNPLGYKSRIRNFKAFSKFAGISFPHAELHVAEVAYGSSDFKVSSSEYGNYRFRTDSELWLKETVLNEIIKHLPSDAEYIAWMDADVILTDPNWVANTIELLQHYDVIQMFSHTQDLGVSNQPSGPILQSYYYRYVSGGRDLDDLNKNKDMITGLAWASKKSVLTDIGMLPDWCVFGSGDRSIAAGCIGNFGYGFKGGAEGLARGFVDKCLNWERRAYNRIQGNVSYLPGLLLHYWHGDRTKRGYIDRWQLMRETQFDPEEHLIRDWQGLYKLDSQAENFTLIRDSFRQLMRERNEDDPGERLIP